MSASLPQAENQRSSQVYLTGLLELEAWTELQSQVLQSMAWEQAERLHLFLTEHPHGVSVGRHGSRAHFCMPSDELRRREISVAWKDHAGGCVFHAPGQLAVYPLVSLNAFDGDFHVFEEMFRQGLEECVWSLGVRHRTAWDARGLLGRSGRLITMGITVQDRAVRFGAWINVCPDVRLMRRVASDPEAGVRAGSLTLERRRPVTMSEVRSHLIEQLPAALGFPRCHVYTGHPWTRERDGVVWSLP